MNGAIHAPSGQRGFTMLEAALSVTIMGALMIAMMVSRKLDTSGGANASDVTFRDSVVTALYNFAKRNHRLPCPDVNGDGFEDVVAGVCNSAIKSGGVPYYTLGMTLSGPLGTGIDRLLVYSVYRGSGVVARDLTMSAERSLPTPHVAPNVSFDNVDDLKQALINAGAASSPVVATEVYVTGNDTDSGVSDCSANKVANMAFVVAFAGSLNADGAGSEFDGAHLVGVGWDATTKWSSVQANTCFVGPGKPVSPTYDDQVRAISFAELIGVLSR
jgi:hypothetical protein